METNTSEPLIKYRKRKEVIKTMGKSLTWDKTEGYPAYCLCDDRYEGGVNVVQASVRNVGTC